MDDPAQNYTTRLLPREEWYRLAGTEAEQLGAFTRPGQAEVLVIERQGEIVGCWALLRVIHVECLWVAPAHRKTSTVLGRLLFGMRKVARAMGATRVVSTALTPEVEGLLVKVKGEAIPGRHYSFPV